MNFHIPELDVYVPWYGRPSLEIWHKVKQFVYERDKGKCQYCGQPVEYRQSHCHHVLELSQGGTNHLSNLKTLCVPCHESRHPYMKNMR